jgi:anti-sigma28 factor (negative regulator of flagellin synthesis)
MSEVAAMRKEFWNSWTCPAGDDEMGQPMEGTSSDSDGGRRVWQRPYRASWLDRAFQVSLAETLERSVRIDSSEEVRIDLVERVRAKIAKGTYRVPADMLAEKLIHRLRKAD